MVGMLEVPMAKISGRGGPRPGAGRPRTDRDDISVKMDRATVARARFVADVKGISLAEYLTEAARPVIQKDFEKATKDGGKA